MKRSRLSIEDIKKEALRLKRARGLKVGDKVKIISGAEKGKISSILRFEKTGVVVKECNMKYRFINKMDPQEKKTSVVRVFRESPIDTSKIMICNSDGIASKIGWKIEGDVKTRILKKTGEAI